jgi:hypothetical protein
MQGKKENIFFIFYFIYLSFGKKTHFFLNKIAQNMLNGCLSNTHLHQKKTFNKNIVSQTRP